MKIKKAFIHSSIIKTKYFIDWNIFNSSKFIIFKTLVNNKDKLIFRDDDYIQIYLKINKRKNVKIKKKKDIKSNIKFKPIL